LPNAVDFDQHFHHPDASTLLNEQNPNSEQFKELLLALVLCHHA
jgi:magnesium-transporting ATPase (P-type)